MPGMMPPLWKDADQVEPFWPPLVAGFAGLISAWATFGQFLWANIFVDGRPEATFGQVLGGTLPTVMLFWVPALVALAVAVRRSGERAWRPFGWAHLGFLGFILGGSLTAVALVGSLALAGSVLWSMGAGRLRPAPVALVALLTSPALLVWAAWAESHRSPWG